MVDLLWCGIHQQGKFWAYVLLRVGLFCCGPCLSARHSLRLYTAADSLLLGSGGALAAFLGCTYGWHLMMLSSVDCGA